MKNKLTEVILSLYNKYKSSKPLYKFIINGLLVYSIWIVFYEVFRYTPFIDFYYNKITYFLTNSWLYSTKAFLTVLGYHVDIYVDRKIIQLQGTQGVLLERGCLGRNMMGLFAGFILVYPGNIKSKLWYIPLGLIVIYILNMLRISGLSLVQLYYPEYMDVSHHTIFKYTVYTAIFIMWAIWIGKINNKETSIPKEELSPKVEDKPSS